MLSVVYGGHYQHLYYAHLIIMMYCWVHCGVFINMNQRVQMSSDVISYATVH